MIHSVDARENRLFDPFDSVIPPAGRKILGEGWQGVFRAVLREVMPVAARVFQFRDADAVGAPTEELDSLAGLVFLADFFGWTAQEAAEAWIFRTDVQYALNLEPGATVSAGAVERYQALFRDNDQAARVFEDVTEGLVRALDRKVSGERLDSTHVFSRMARFGRTKLVVVALERFLSRLKRYDSVSGASAARPPEVPTGPCGSSHGSGPGTLRARLDPLTGGRCRMSTTSDTLLERLRLGADGDAWSQFVDLYTPLIRGWLRRDVKLGAEADDLVQEVLCVVVRKLPQFRREPRPGAFRCWLRGITVNCLRDLWRARRGRPLTVGAGEFLAVLRQLEDPQSELSCLWDREHDRHVVQQLLALIRPHFEPTTWTAFQKVVMEGRPTQQVARELGLSVNAVFIAKSRVLSRLRREGEGLID
jgi:RNA polymerase sigma-70 factor (ECF subfamily)